MHLVSNFIHSIRGSSYYQLLPSVVSSGHTHGKHVLLCFAGDDKSANVVDFHQFLHRVHNDHPSHHTYGRPESANLESKLAS